ncbi:hypothetical protein [uncultured Marivita sp.]|uniref:hypothetical protein n=1 Tax=uncultured Marivita sp. TaxID=888080 RepID=UPI00260AF033|nr:hypothetical protein [uncultured Marivita sp.]
MKGFYSHVIPNKIDRILHLVNGLQGRSKRNVAMVSTLVAGVAALSVLGNSDNLPELIKMADRCSNANTWHGIVQVSVAALIASIGFFAASMSHIPQVKQGNLGEKTIGEWEKLLVKELEKLELLSWLGGSTFIVAAFLLFISVFLPVFC